MVNLPYCQRKQPIKKNSEKNVGNRLYCCYHLDTMIKRFLILFLCMISIGANAADFQTKAKSVYLFDYDSGDEIFAKNADKLMPPSSMLKLMTLTVLFDAVKSGDLKMDDVLEASENADYNNPLWYPASKRCLVKGQKITVSPE